MDIGNVIAAVVVLAVLGAVFGFILAVASKVFEVKKDPREEEILSHLAGANCGGCGFPGCAGCAAAILAGTAPVNACAPAGAENAAAIAKIMGQEAPSGERKVAFVRCNGGTNAAKRYEYVGVKDCLSATKVAGGPLECQFGCLGFGSCVSACQFGAMSIGPNGAAVVDPDKCTDCMACAKACPRHLITEVPVSKKVHVACANQDKGKAAMHPLLHRLRPVPEGVQEGRHSCGERRGCHRLRQVRGLQALHQGLPAGRHPSHRHRGGEGEVQGHQEGPGGEGRCREGCGDRWRCPVT